MTRPPILSASTLLLLAVACGGGTVTARLDFRNDTAAHAARRAPQTAGGFVQQAPSSFRMKLIAIYLAQDIDPVTQDNVGQSAMIWLNPECRGDISKCNIAGAPDGPWANEVQSLFEFARDSASVNADLNSQGLPISIGTYRYARIEFCKWGGGEPNVRWSAPQLAQPRAFSIPECGVTSKPFATPIVLAKGDSVSVTLAYDLAQAGVFGTPMSPGGPCFGTTKDDARCYVDCGDAANGQRVCVDVPDFTPSATFIAGPGDAGSSDAGK